MQQSDYIYKNRGTIAQSNGTQARPLPTTSTTHRKVEDGSQTKPAIVITETKVCEDHVRRPVIVNPDGTTSPGIVILPPESKPDEIITKVETVVERVYAPSTTTYTTGSVQVSEPTKQYVIVPDRSGKPGLDQPSKINEFITSVQTTASGGGSGVGTGGTGFPIGRFQRRTPEISSYDVGTNPWTRPAAETTQSIGATRWSKSDTNEDRSSGWNRPNTGTTYSVGTDGWTRPTDVSGSGWSKPIGGTTKDSGSSGWNRPSAVTTKDTGLSGWSRPSSGPTGIGVNGWSNQSGDAGNRWSAPSKGNEVVTDGWTRPTVTGTTTTRRPDYYGAPGKYEPDGPRTTSDVSPITTDSRIRPTRLRWSTPPNYESSISKPTADIGAITDYVREPTRPAPTNMGRFSSPAFTPKETVAETIDSNEAARRYKGIQVPTTKETPSATIDAQEAAKRYGGAFV